MTKAQQSAAAAPAQETTAEGVEFQRLMQSPRRSLIERTAARFEVEPKHLLSSLKAVAFRQRDGDPQVTDDQLIALLIVADQYGLNPYTKEIYAFPDKQRGIIPVVSVDGWIRIINSHEQMQSIEFAYPDTEVQPSDGRFDGLKHPAYEWVECAIKRKDRDTPINVREHLDECYRAPITRTGSGGKPYTIEGPWQTHTRRFLRHKALIQCARVAFGFIGIFDEDEAARIREQSADRREHLSSLRDQIQRKPSAAAQQIADDALLAANQAPAPAAVQEPEPDDAHAADAKQPPPVDEFTAAYDAAEAREQAGQAGDLLDPETGEIIAPKAAGGRGKRP